MSSVGPEARVEELEALQAIYGAELRILGQDEDLHFEVGVSAVDSRVPEAGVPSIRLKFHLPRGYPTGGYRARARVGLAQELVAGSLCSLSPDELELLRSQIQKRCEEAAKAQTAVCYEVVELARSFLMQHLTTSDQAGHSADIRPLHEAMLARQEQHQRERVVIEQMELERSRERHRAFQQLREEAEQLQQLEALAAEERLGRKLKYQCLVESSGPDQRPTMVPGMRIPVQAWEAHSSWTILQALQETSSGQPGTSTYALSDGAASQTQRNHSRDAKEASCESYWVIDTPDTSSSESASTALCGSSTPFADSEEEIPEPLTINGSQAAEALVTVPERRATTTTTILETTTGETEKDQLSLGDSFIEATTGETEKDQILLGDSITNATRACLYQRDRSSNRRTAYTQRTTLQKSTLREDAVPAMAAATATSENRLLSELQNKQEQKRCQLLEWLLSQLVAQMEPRQAARAIRRWQRRLGVCPAFKDDDIPHAPLAFCLDDLTLTTMATTALSQTNPETMGRSAQLEHSVEHLLGRSAWRLLRDSLAPQPSEWPRNGSQIQRRPHSSRIKTLRAHSDHDKEPNATAPKRTSRFETDFEILTLLGRGGFGAVVKARQRLDGRLYAIKIVPLHHQDLEDPRILRETTTLSRLSHPRCVRYYGCWVESADSLLAMNTASRRARPGMTPADASLEPRDILRATSNLALETESDVFSLQALLRDLSSSALSSEQRTAPTSPPRAVVAFLFIQMEYCPRTLRAFIDYDIDAGIDLWAIFRQIVEGVQYLHSLMLLHRDLKPTNIFVLGPSWEPSTAGATMTCRSGDWPLDRDPISIKIGDFGLATMMNMASLSRSERHPVDEVTPSNETNLQNTLLIDKNAVELTRSVGTAFYRAPELSATSGCQESAKRDAVGIANTDDLSVTSKAPAYDSKVDIYSLGVILFELFYGPMTSGSGTTTEHERYVMLTALRERLQVPPAFAERLPRQTRLVRLLMAKDPCERPSADELLKLLPAKVEQEYWSDLLQIIADPVSSSDRQLRARAIRALFESAKREQVRQNRGRLPLPIRQSSLTSQNTTVSPSSLEIPSLPWDWITRAYILLRRHHGQEFVLQRTGDDTGRWSDTDKVFSLTRAGADDSDLPRHHGPGKEWQASSVLLPNGEFAWLPSERFLPFIRQWLEDVAARESRGLASTPLYRCIRWETVWHWSATDVDGSPMDLLANDGLDASVVGSQHGYNATRSREKNGLSPNEPLDWRLRAASSQADAPNRPREAASGLETIPSAGAPQSVSVETSSPSDAGPASAASRVVGRPRVLRAGTLLEWDSLQLEDSRPPTGTLLPGAELLFIATTLVHQLCFEVAPTASAASPEQSDFQPATSLRRVLNPRRRHRRTADANASLPSAEGILIRLGHTQLTRIMTMSLLHGSRPDKVRDTDRDRALQTLRQTLHQHLRLGWNGTMRLLAPDHPWRQPGAENARRQAEQLAHASRQLAPLSMLHQLRTRLAATYSDPSTLFASLAQLESVLHQWALLLGRREWLERWLQEPSEPEEPRKAGLGGSTRSRPEVLLASQPWPSQGPYRVLLDPFLWPTAPCVERFADGEGICFEISLVTPSDPLRSFRPVIWGGHWQGTVTIEGTTHNRDPQQRPGVTSREQRKLRVAGNGLVADLCLMERFRQRFSRPEGPLEHPPWPIYVGMLRESSTTMTPDGSAETFYLIVLGVLWRRGWTCFWDTFGNDTDREAGRSTHEHIQRAAQVRCRLAVLLHAQGTSAYLRELPASPMMEHESRPGHRRAERLHEITLQLEHPGGYVELAERVAQTVYDLTQRQER
jgi:serine/threonine protein kinase